MPKETVDEQIARLEREAAEALEEADQLQEYFRLKSMSPAELQAEARTIAEETHADYQAVLDSLELVISAADGGELRRQMFPLLKRAGGDV